MNHNFTIWGANRFPFAPDNNNNAPNDAAKPMHSVCTSGLIKFIVSNIAKPAVVDPPGLLMYKNISFSASSASKIIIELLHYSLLDHLFLNR